jgi:hypothetical protein
MGSGAMICIPIFIQIVSGIQKSMKMGLHRQQGDLISLLLFFKNKESWLKCSVQSKETFFKLIFFKKYETINCFNLP